MAHFIISYDLHNQRTYKPVWDKLESWGATRLLESVWVVSHNNSAGQIRDALNNVIDNDDAVVVIELKPGSNWASTRGSSGGVEWLEQNIRRYIRQ